MKTILEILEYHFPDRAEIDPEELEQIADEIEKVARDGIKDGERFYYHDHCGRRLYPLCAIDRLEAHEEAESCFSTDFSIAILDKEDLELYKKDGWEVMDEDF